MHCHISYCIAWPRCSLQLRQPEISNDMHLYTMGLRCEVLMLQWSQAPGIAWSCVELFSGVGNVSAAFREGGKFVASFDKVTGGHAMDITLCAGFLFWAEFAKISYHVCPSKFLFMRLAVWLALGAGHIFHLYKSIRFNIDYGFFSVTSTCVQL